VNEQVIAATTPMIRAAFPSYLAPRKSGMVYAPNCLRYGPRRTARRR
jgi:hypothetical protein